jgi:1-acyl-sn-glycerol-3-phosphate acyltransferase
MPTWWPDGVWPWLVTALLALLVAFGLFVYLLPWSIQTLLRILLAFHYRLRVVGREHVPRTGPGVLAVNHVSWIDGFILAAITPRPGKVLVAKAYIDHPLIRFMAIRSGMIPVPFQGPKAQRAVLTAAQAALDRGELLALFPEAQISRTGVPGTFYRGLEIILSGREHVPVIPVSLDNLWGSYFTFAGGKFFGKRPKHWRRTVGIVFGPPVPAPVKVAELRQAMIENGVEAFELRPPRDRDDLPETLDPTLPRWEHPELGLLAASAPDFQSGVISQVGTKPGSVGQAVPGVALRAFSESGEPLPPDTPGPLRARVAFRPGWADTGATGKVDRDGFVFLDPPA